MECSGKPIVILTNENDDRERVPSAIMEIFVTRRFDGTLQNILAAEILVTLS